MYRGVSLRSIGLNSLQVPTKTPSSFSKSTGNPLLRLKTSQYPRFEANKIAKRFQSTTAAYSKSELENRGQNANLLRFITAYRRYGHITADLDPLELQKQKSPPELLLSRYGLDTLSEDEKFSLDGLISIPGKTEGSLRDIVQHLKSTYCSKVASEFLSIQEVQQRRWFSDAVEAIPYQKLSSEEKIRIFQLMAEAESFDHFMHKKFASVKRYALEGTEAMIPALDTIFSVAAQNGVTNIVIGMPHRGRLNFLVGLLRYPPRDLFWKVKGNSELPPDTIGIGDVLSHIATSVDLEYDGKPIHVTLLQNPSHLEAIDPVAMGQARALQTLLKDKDRSKVMCLQIHGDAAFYGQGTVAETLGLSKLPEFTVGGSFHLIVNNQLGFTTPAVHARSSRYSADLGKITDSPAIHVNGDSPEDVVKATKVAMDFKLKFQSDVILDIVGYRRHGHNEVDEPSFTNPNMYKTIRSKQSVITTYKAKLEDEGLLTTDEATDFIKKCDDYLASELNSIGPQKETKQHLQGRWQEFKQPADITQRVKTGVPADVLKDIGLKSATTPPEIQVHPRLQKFFIASRLGSIEKNSIDWATAEAMAFGSLLKDKYNIRLCGQDSGRGTFSQRHAELVDQNSEAKYIPLNNLSSDQGKLQLVNSPLSELAVLAFEYGYSIADPKTLPIWEAQFGDFANGAQICIDNFVISGEAKWLKQSGLTMLLPHGYDGTGPEHSSSRLERFLQLTDQDEINLFSAKNKNPNIRVINLTTPANYFHALRRQLLTDYRKPLVVMAPKILLKHPQALSTLEDMGPDSYFMPVISDNSVEPKSVERVIFCSGKIYVDLLAERQKKEYTTNTALVRIEEFSPFPADLVKAEYEKFSNASEFFWVQDESQNSGGWSFIHPRLSQFNKIKYVGRPPCPAVAVGIATIHNQETANILNSAFPPK